MITVENALQLVLDSAKRLSAESVMLSEAIGRILAEDIYADRPMPPFDRVTMDGIAILYSSFQDNNTLFEIEAIGPARHMFASILLFSALSFLGRVDASPP